MVIVAFAAVVVAGLFKAAMMFGPNAPFLVFQGKLLEEGTHFEGDHLGTPAQLLLDVFIKDGKGGFQPMTLIKAWSLPNYRLRLSANLKDPRILNTAVLRAHTLDYGGKLGSAEFELKDNKTLYEEDIYLSYRGDVGDFLDEDGMSFITFAGHIYENGRPAPAHITLDIYHKNAKYEAVSLMQVNSPSKYEIQINRMLFETKEFSRTFVLRFQSLSVSGGSALLNFTTNDRSSFYKGSVELNSRLRNRPGYNPDDDYIY